MRTIKADIMDGNEPLSKALGTVLKSGTAIVITDKGKYCGIIDDRNVRRGLKDASRMKTVHAAVMAPQLAPDSTLEEAIRAFMTGHFKALPIVKKGAVMGIATRADVMNEMVTEGVVPKTRVSALMASPLYTIDRDEKLGVARTLMKRFNVHRLAVTEGSRVTGTISTLDLSMFLLNPSARDRFTLLSEVANPDNEPVRKYMREKMVVVNSGDRLDDAVRKMAKENVSNLVVYEGGNAVGVLSASDVMKFVISMVSEGPEVFISGLSGDDLAQHDEIRSALSAVLKKFSNSFEFGNANVRFKRGKSVYSMSSRIELGNQQLVVHSEGYDLKGAVAANVNEIKMLLNKKKNCNDTDKHYAEGFYEGAG